MRSIRRRLLLTLLSIVLAGVMSAGWLIYRQAQAEVNELFDYQLQQTAAALPSEPFPAVLSANQDDTPRGGDVVIQIWSHNGTQLYYSHPRAPLAPHAELGFSTEHTPRGDWRVYGAVIGDNVVQVAQPLSIRNEIAALTAWHTLWPLVVLMPVLGLLVWITVGRGLLPLQRVTQAVDARHPDALDAMPDARLPIEVQPLVHALNRLLQRLGVALDTQKAFVADAAHELRTPLAALNLQLQLLERAASEEERRDALADLRRGVLRSTRLVEQLLALARAEPGAATAMGAGHGSAGDVGAAIGAGRSPAAGLSSMPALGSASPRMCQVDLLEIVSDCVSDRMTLANHKKLDLGFAGTEPLSVTGDAVALRVLFNNLVDNAIKYTPPGGRIDLALLREDGRAVVEICDTGPGIPAHERARVFDRFYRRAVNFDAGPSAIAASGELEAPAGEAVAGSGLGLAIVQRIASQHGATVTLSDGPAGRGLRVSVRF
jgi:two-component system OmpR family sensor kinase